MTITYHRNIAQRSPEWYALRCGMLTASEMKNVITPKTLQPVKKKNPDEEIDLLWKLASERIMKYAEPEFSTYDMLRGYDDEADALYHYREHYGEVEDCGLVTNDQWGFTLGFSPDGLRGDDGIVECKGRMPKFQLETILSGVMPDEYRIQVQTGLLI